tara:strand:+ start:160 stop:318 length:159 start_codon:yes stop_codon:yes gene_type:complete
MEDVDDLNYFWLGRERSLQDYQNWAGVNFKSQSITEEALAGNFPRSSDGVSQ